VRNQQLQRRKGRVSLLPGERQPLLPPIEELSKYADPTAGAKKPEPGTDPSKPVRTSPLPEQVQPEQNGPPQREAQPEPQPQAATPQPQAATPQPPGAQSQ
jgi:hypothetical protein